MNELKIKKAENGFILTTYEVVSDDSQVGTLTEVRWVAKGKHDEDEKGALSALFCLIADLYGHGYDKWGNENLNVRWNGKGHKWCSPERGNGNPDPII